MQPITFYLLSLGFLCMPALYCMEDGQETLEEFNTYIMRLNYGGPLIPGNHTNNTQQSEETLSEGVVALLRAPVLVGTRASARNVQPQEMNQPIIISYNENSLKLQKPQPALDYVTIMETDNNPDRFRFAYEHGIVARPHDHEALYLAMKRFQSSASEKSSTDTDSASSDESDSDN